MTRIDNVNFKNLIEKYPDLWENKKIEKNDILVKKILYLLL